MKTKILHFQLVFILLLIFHFPAYSQWNVNSNFWSGTDELGRTTPKAHEVGNVKDGKYVGMFYFTWHTDQLADFDPVMNVTEILNEYPEAIDDFDHAAWQGITPGVFFWDEPLFGYYRTTDDWVLRKHAEMLADAGVDVVFCDATNGNYTWKSAYTKLLEVWNQARLDGVKTPKFAFLLPFGPTQGALESMYEVYSDLYEPGLYEDLWFMWKGKPLIMAYPETLDIPVDKTDAAGLKFTASSEFTSVDATCPSWNNSIGNLTFSLYTWNGSYQTSVAQEALASKIFVDFADNAKLILEFDAIGPGEYVWELTDAIETVGVWKYIEDTESTFSYFNSAIVSGEYESKIKYVSEGDFTNLTIGSYATHVPIPIAEGGIFDSEKLSEIKDFFTFRPAQADYVTGPTRTDQWGWLESYPQHGFAWKSNTGYEQVPVGIAQNANDVSGGRCASFNAPNSYGRSYTKLNGWDTRENAYLWGANFEEQWNRAEELDPEMIWITGWNEWIMGRHKDWPGCSGGAQVENAFPDAFDAERSRDIEPVKSWGNNGDVYYMQLVDKVRKFKGMDKQDTASAELTIQVGSFDDWSGVKPEFWHYRGNTIERNHPGHGQTLVYTNTTGRNDIVLAKVARDNENIYFYVETADSLSPKTDEKWMRLFIDIDRDKSTGWEGYDFVLNRESPAESIIVEKSITDWEWTKAGEASYAVSDSMIEIQLSRSVLGIANGEDLNFEFKWSDNMQEDGNIMDFYQYGDAAPGGRFNFVYSTDPNLYVNTPEIISTKSYLLDIYPNPSREITNIKFSLPESVNIKLSIYNLMGQKIKTLLDEERTAGNNMLQWNMTNEKGQKVSSGIYFCRLETAGYETRIRRIMVIE